MNRITFKLIALCGFLFIIIVFSASTCVLVENEENNKYSLNVQNDSNFPVKMIIWGFRQELLETGNSAQYYVAPGITIDAVYQAATETWVEIRGTEKFPFKMPPTGMNIVIINSDIGTLTAER